VRDEQIGRPLAQNRFLQGLLAVYLGVWTLAAIAPHDRADWLLENLLVFAFAGLLAATHRRFVFSNLSWLLLGLFMALHAVGAHYTYSLTPLGFWLQDALGLERNHYDRLVHFAFGLLLVYPARELGLRVLELRGGASWLIPLAIVISASAVYEIAESWAARIVDPELGTAFVGTQGDEWDAQKDMTLALLGAVLGLGAAAAYRSLRGREAWELLRSSGGSRS
jgi:putative membrane protein